MPSDFSVVAIIAAYNEADVIDHVVADLIEQGVRVYFLDDGSTDGTAAIVERRAGRGVIGIERRAEPGAEAAAAAFDWERILLRKAQLAQELDADWFIHHDADEFRESPWAHLSLKEAIRRVDALGFNAIDFNCFDFWPVHDGFHPGDDVREAFTCYAAPAPYDRLQIRCWKKTGEAVDLASSGGHEARFPGRCAFPIRFILRHYPIRGQAHGERKVFHERRRRFTPRERARRWHVQYDAMQEGASFIRDRATLTPYDPDAVRLELMLHHRGVEALDASLAEARVAINAGRQALAARTEELEQTTAALVRTRTELAAARADLETDCARIAVLEDALDRQTRQIDGLRNAVNESDRRLDEFHQSLSWRWTSPARAAFRLLRGR